MIMHLTSFTDLTFPIVTLSKKYKIKEDLSTLYFDDIALVKQGNLTDTINLNVVELPLTISMFAIPEAVLKAPKLLGSKFVLDNTLSIWIPCKRVTYKISTYELQIIKGDYMKVLGIPYWLPYYGDKSATYVVIAEVDGLYFAIGWSAIKINETKAI